MNQILQKIIHFTPLEKSRPNKQKSSFWHSLTGFIKYHNAFTIGLVIVFMVGGAVLADEEVRDKVIGEAKMERQGIDNAALLAADLDNFDWAMQIDDVSEDEDNYYVAYHYQTLAIAEAIWQPATKEVTLTVAKKALADEDLGLYVAEELSEVLVGQLVYLKEVKQNEEKKGQTLIQETTQYSGLIGLVLNPKTKELPGYEPVVKPEPQVKVDSSQIIPQEISAALAREREEVEARKRELLANTLANDFLAPGNSDLLGGPTLTLPPAPPADAEAPDSSSGSDADLPATNEDNGNEPSAESEGENNEPEEPSNNSADNGADNGDNNPGGEAVDDGTSNSNVDDVAESGAADGHNHDVNSESQPSTETTVSD